MPNNLKEKISFVLDDIKNLQRSEAIKAIENLIHQETGFLNANYEISSHDLYLISSLATKKYIDKDQSERTLGSIGGDPQMVRTLMYADSMIEYLRGKGLINFTLTFKKK